MAGRVVSETPARRLKRCSRRLSTCAPFRRHASIFGLVCYLRCDGLRAAPALHLRGNARHQEAYANHGGSDARLHAGRQQLLQLRAGKRWVGTPLVCESCHASSQPLSFLSHVVGLGVRDGGGGGRRREDDSRRAEPGSSMDGTIELYTGIQRLRI